MRSRRPSFVVSIALPLSAVLILPGIRWCSLTWCELSATCALRCVVIPEAECPAVPAAERDACDSSCPMAAGNECPLANAPAPEPDRDGRAFCFRDTPALPGPQLASPGGPQLAIAHLPARAELETPAPITRRLALEPRARPPSRPWRTSPPVRGPPTLETT